MFHDQNCYQTNIITRKKHLTKNNTLSVICSAIDGFQNVPIKINYKCRAFGSKPLKYHITHNYDVWKIC